MSARTTTCRTARSAADPAVSWHLVAHLECFWPSRRTDTFDGLRRSAR